MGRYGDAEKPEGQGREWALDERGRRYKADAQGRRTYASIGERDEAADESYRFGAVIYALLGLPGDQPLRNVVALICVNAPELAELYWREEAQYQHTSLRGKVEMFCGSRLGRVPEPCAWAALWTEIRSRREGSRLVVDRLFASYQEQQRFARAARETPDCGVDEGGIMERLERILERATGKRAAAHAMPRPPSRRAWERRSNALKAEANALATQAAPAAAGVL